MEQSSSELVLPPDGATEQIGAADAPPASPMMDMAEAGGPVLLLIAAMSVAALGVMIAKLFQMRGMAPRRRALENVMASVDKGELPDASKAAGKIGGPLGKVLGEALAEAGRMPLAILRERAVLQAEAALETLRSHLRFLEVIALTAPLLGLLGTVLGMIEAFQTLAEASGRADPSQLSGGIWEALLTTAAGLAVAIPVTAAVNWLDRRIERLAHLMEQSLARLFLHLDHPERTHDRGNAFLKAAD
ncbi:MotA/TolQ/ExbB proton channel family protein [Tepidicaulis sp. LMO-SS28]|uniref:MotA/TolQ/ExbB proton channel family protein n=1 Tax=Tepidicaulis sp. LMO-SS28 TaxID=3447455 RepID=UPI003EDEA3C4